MQGKYDTCKLDLIIAENTIVTLENEILILEEKLQQCGILNQTHFELLEKYNKLLVKYIELQANWTQLYEDCSAGLPPCPHGVGCEISCFGIQYDHPEVCSGHGDCVDVDNCLCKDSYYGTNCENHNGTCQSCDEKTKFIYYNFIQNDPNTGSWSWDDSDYTPIENLVCGGSSLGCVFGTYNGIVCLLIVPGSTVYHIPSSKLASIEQDYSVEFTLGWKYNPFATCSQFTGKAYFAEITIGAWIIKFYIQSYYFGLTNVYTWSINVEIFHSASFLLSKKLYNMEIYCDGSTLFIYENLNPFNVEIEQTLNPNNVKIYINGINVGTYSGVYPMMFSDIRIAPRNDFGIDLHLYILQFGVNNRSMLPEEREFWKNNMRSNSLQRFSPWLCFGEKCTSENVCSGHGICTGTNNCCCDEGWLGSQCQYPNRTWCPECPSGGEECPCNCTLLETCQDQLITQTECCETKTQEVEDCEVLLYEFTCNNLTQGDSDVCNGRGECVAQDRCNCEEGYYGYDCESESTSVVYTCFGISGDNPTVCSGNGICYGTDQCACINNYIGYDCNDTCPTGDEITCQDISADDPTVCNGHGECIADGVCSCEDTYTGKWCQRWYCYGIFRRKRWACGWHGECVATDTCECDDGWMGDDCDIPICFEIPGNDPTVCSGHGKPHWKHPYGCRAPDTCKCEKGWTGLNCSEPVQECSWPWKNWPHCDQKIKCHDIYADAPGVCGNVDYHSTKGTCLKDGCKCHGGYFGDNCCYYSYTLYLQWLSEQ